MSWGMFLYIPCPVKIWREEAKGHTLSMLPFIGLVIGALWALVSHFLICSLPVKALILTIIPWFLSGGIHLDGYMDVCDAIGSRRDLETRQRILKDSSCGAFAVIGMVVLALASFAFFTSADKISCIGLLLIPIASRACAAIAVMIFKPMDSSQYISLKKSINLFVVPVIAILFIIIFSILQHQTAPIATMIAFFVFALYGRQSLGGMNGDISGFALTLSELCGIIFLCTWG